MTHSPYETEWVDADHSLETDDEWHSHAGEAPPQHAHGQTSPGAIAFFGLGSFIALLITLAAITVFFNQATRDERYTKIERVDLLGTDIVQRKAAWRAELADYGWTSHTSVTIPIDRAIESTALEYASSR